MLRENVPIPISKGPDSNLSRRERCLKFFSNYHKGIFRDDQGRSWEFPPVVGSSSTSAAPIETPWGALTSKFPWCKRIVFPTPLGRLVRKTSGQSAVSYLYFLKLGYQVELALSTQLSSSRVIFICTNNSVQQPLKSMYRYTIK